jgi:hypothetical protein
MEVTMCTPDQLLAQAEADLEVATRRREIAQAIAADWGWWSSALNGSGVPQDAHEETAAAAQPGQAERVQDASECQQCHGPIPPSARRGGRPRKFCSQKCGNAWHAKRCLQRKRAAAKTEIELPPEPLPDIRPEERPLHSAEYEDRWLREQLKPPALPWEAREAH